jgi:hypothetical protein
MGLEQTFERIADSLDRIASTLEENTKINAWYKSHLCKCDGSCAPDAPPPEELAATETTTETVVADKPAVSPVAEPEDPAKNPDVIAAVAHVSRSPIATTALGKDLTFDELKLELAARGYLYKKGTKSTTLQREWDLHKHEPLVGVTGAAPTTAPVPVEKPEEKVASDEAFDPLSVGAIVLPTEPPAIMTADDCRKIITQEFVKGKDEQCIINALVACGVREFRELKEGQYEAFVAEFRKQKEARDAGK